MTLWGSLPGGLTHRGPCRKQMALPSVMGLSLISDFRLLLVVLHL